MLLNPNILIWSVKNMGHNGCQTIILSTHINYLLYEIVCVSLPNQMNQSSYYRNLLKLYKTYMTDN